MRKYLAIIIILVLVSCQEKQAHDHGFYYWRTTFNLNANERQLLTQAKAPALYTRFFDIQKRNNAYEAVGVLQKKDQATFNKKVVPVIFITNETWYNISKKDITFLAQKTSDNIMRMGQNLKFNLEHEIQIDSDWTQGTKDDYFLFLQELKRISKKNITSTLRLHQVRDKKIMGVPPVEKLYLMCYATTSPLEKSDKNSILDIKLLKSYLGDIENYPVKLDIALPIYSWGIVTNHLGQHKLINAIKTSDLQNDNFEKIADHRYKVLKDDFYFGLYLNQGFEIKVEEVSEETLTESINFIDTKLKYPYQIIYYHLDSQFTQHYNKLLK